MAALELQNVSHAYGPLKVISDVNITIERGERHAIIGPNGAGKSTLINIISGRVRPTAGRVLLDGRDITRMGPHERAKAGIGRAFQIINVFPELTVLQNIESAILPRVGLSWNVTRRLKHLTNVKAMALDVARTLDLTHRLDSASSTLAYGEQRRLEIALCLALEPRVMLLDEPCAGLNAEDVHAATALIQTASDGRTLIMVEHDMDVVFGFSDRVTVLHQGRVLCSDKAALVRQNEDVKRAYLGGHDGSHR
jgi:branched-chain amino acid transport system ATP-binding protein